MLAELSELSGALQCPRTGRPIQADTERVIGLDGGDDLPEYPVVDGIPVIIDFDTSVIQRHDLINTDAASVVSRPTFSFGQKFIKSLLSPEKKSTKRNVESLITRLKSASDRPRVLVIGGGSIGQGMARLYDDPGISVTAFDIYASPLVQFVADAHNIPIIDDHFDGVVIQAVLEHVLQPQRVADEIWRVLKRGGLVYAETPFMQQVHEGAYDFTRYTESGHRYLFRKFKLIDSGPTAGPGRQLMWSVDYFARSVFRSRTAGKIAKLAFFWAQYFDDFIPKEHATDGASGVYFLGSKADSTITQHEIIEHYAGAQ